MNNADHPNTIRELSVGDDLVLAQAMAASLDAENIDAELVLSSDPYVGLAHSSPHRLMIKERDVEAARPILAAHLEAAAHDESGPSAVNRRRTAVALPLLAVLAGGPLIVLVLIIREIIG